MSTTLFDRFEIVDPYPALFDPSLDAVILSDLHLGLESLMARDGTYIPKTQLESIKKDVEAIVGKVDPAKIIICGDIKHEFSETTYGEREEVQEFIEFLTELVDDILLVQGNHDNYLIYPVQDFDTVQLEDYYVLEDVLFIHGHELYDDLETINAEHVIIGHEHPALALQDDVGVTEKMDCFLYGTMNDGRNLIVLPAFTPLANGTPMNRVKNPENDLLSPFLKEKIDINTMKAIAIDRDAGTFEFPAVGRI